MCGRLAILLFPSLADSMSVSPRPHPSHLFQWGDHVRVKDETPADILQAAGIYVGLTGHVVEFRFTYEDGLPLVVVAVAGQEGHWRRIPPHALELDAETPPRPWWDAIK